MQVLSAAPGKPVVYSYWAGWSNAQIPDYKFDGLFLAFALLHSDGRGTYYTDYSASGNFQNPANSGTYTIWNNWLRKYWNEGARAYVSYGGATNDDFRKIIIEANAEQLTKIAGEIKANIKNFYYDGVDLDIEGWWHYGNSDNIKFANNLARMVKILRKSLDDDTATKGKIIMIATGWHAAGQVAGMYDTGNAYAGTMRPFFADPDAMNAISAVNIMTYNTGIKNFYSRADLAINILNQFVIAGVDRQKLIFGIQPCESANAGPTPSSTIKTLAETIKLNNFGGMFMWGIGTSGLCGQNPAEYLTAMQQGLQ